jgi:hypothetical protein
MKEIIPNDCQAVKLKWFLNRWEGMNCINLAYDWNLQQFLIKNVMNLL